MAKKNSEAVETNASSAVMQGPTDTATTHEPMMPAGIATGVMVPTEAVAEAVVNTPASIAAEMASPPVAEPVAVRVRREKSFLQKFGSIARMFDALTDDERGRMLKMLNESFPSKPAVSG